MTKYNTGPTASAILGAAETLELAARELHYIAGEMTKSGDITYAAQAANTLANIMQNVHLDLLVSRPLRETMKG